MWRMTISSTFITPGRGKTARVRLDSDDRNCIEGSGQSGSQREAAMAGYYPKRNAGSPNYTPITKQITTDRCGVRWM
jgi:hypothetical protein